MRYGLTDYESAASRPAHQLFAIISDAGSSLSADNVRRCPGFVAPRIGL